eukprot:m.139302 g.139302  ORF g.139302 m.139302 type:complete len:99 (+) comp15940_c0_seq8:1424-1720(+)
MGRFILQILLLLPAASTVYFAARKATDEYFLISSEPVLTKVLFKTTRHDLHSNRAWVSVKPSIDCCSLPFNRWTNVGCCLDGLPWRLCLFLSVSVAPA